MSKKLLGAIFLISAFSAYAASPLTPVHASVTPTLSVLALGDGDSVQLNVTGDPSTSVLLSYFKTGYGQQISSVGSTNSNGTLTTTISSSGYGIASNGIVHIILGSINGPASAPVTWPPVSSLISSGNALSFSQTGLVLAIGQSSTITASNMNSGSLYLSSNSNPMIANVSLSGSQITVLANSYGSTVATICLTNSSSNCGSIYVTVQNSSAQALTFSQNSISLSSGQSVAVQISGGTGSYVVSNNSSQNQGIVQSSISGSTITLTTSSTTGSSSITVCSSDMSSCGIINVTIGAATNSGVSFSQSNPTVTVGQSVQVSIYGPSSSLFYVSSNSSPNVVQANISGTTLSLLGITNGSSTISICASTSNCASITVTVNYNYTTTGKLALSQDSVSLASGQTLSITISGGEMPYTISSNANNIFQPTLNTNILSLYGVSSGLSSMNVCSSDGECVTLSVAVNGSNTVSVLPSGCVSATGFSQTTGMPCNSSVVPTSSTPILTIESLSPGMTVGEGQTVIFNALASGFSPASYFLSDAFGGTTISSTNINQSGYFTWVPTANDIGTHTINVIAVDSSGHSANTSQVITVQSAPVVSQEQDTSLGCQGSTYNTMTGQVCPSSTVVVTPSVVSTPVTTTTVTPQFTKLIKSGATGAEVIALQKKLHTLGFYNGRIDGGFGAATLKAVKAFQKAHKLTQDGVVGTGTLRALGLS